MSYIKIHQEKITDGDALKALCPFGAIEETVREAVAEASFLENARSLEELIAADRAAREYAKRAVERLAQNKI